MKAFITARSAIAEGLADVVEAAEAAPLLPLWEVCALPKYLCFHEAKFKRAPNYERQG